MRSKKGVQQMGQNFADRLMCVTFVEISVILFYIKKCLSVRSAAYHHVHPSLTKRCIIMKYSGGIDTLYCNAII